MKYWKKAPIYFWVADLWPDTLLAVSPIKSPLILNMINLLVKFIYRHCDTILVTSKGFIPKIVHDQKVPEDKIKYWPQWAEDFYQMENLSLDTPEGREMPAGFKIVFAGNIGSAQAFDTILSAADQLKEFSDIQWIIFGDGSEKERIIKELENKNLKGNFHFMGPRPAETMSRYYSLANGLLITLKKDPLFALTVPGKIQSYMACGKPVLACIDGEGKRIVEEADCGPTCSAEDPEELSKMIRDFYHTPEKERDEMGLKGFHYCQKNFNREQLLTQLLSWMN